MLKRLFFCFMVMWLVSVTSAHAFSLFFYDYFELKEAVKLNKKNKHFRYTHNILDDGFNPLTDRVVSSVLYVGVRDDRDPGKKERVKTWLDGVNYGKREVGKSDEVYYPANGLVQDDGTLNVRLKRKKGDFYFKGSKLEVHACRKEAPAQPVPEPATLVMFGMGILGSVFGLRRKKK